MITWIVMLASVANANEITDAFKNCLNKNVVVEKEDEASEAKGRLNLIKSRVDGTSDSVLRLNCKADEAKALFEAVDNYKTRERTAVWTSGEEIQTRFFGEAVRPSQCNRKLKEKDGTPVVNYYWCNIGIDVTSDFTKALNADE